MKPIASSLLALSLAGCVSQTNPRPGRLEGTWVSTDATEDVHRGLEIERLDEPVGGIELGYVLYRYPIGDPPEPVQSGLLSVVDGELLWDVRWDIDPLNVGIRFADPLERVSRGELVIRGRSWQAADALIPGDTTAPVFGEAAWVVPVGPGLNTALDIDADGVHLGRSAITGDRLFHVPPSGRDAIDVRLDRSNNGQFQPVLGYAGDVGYHEAGQLYRARPTLIPGDAFTPDRYELETVWQQPYFCGSLSRTADRWAAICQIDGVEGLAWLDPEDGAVLDHHPLSWSVLQRSTWRVGDDVLVASYDPSPTPGLHGERSDDGTLLQRIGSDGAVRWTWWMPGRPFLRHATGLDDGTTVVLMTTGPGLAGASSVADTRRAALLALDASGQVRWERDLPYDDGFGVAIAPAADGLVLAAGVDGTQDFGGAVGAPAAPTGASLALVALDACGQAEAAVTFDACGGTEACGGTATVNADVNAQAMARGDDGALYLHALFEGTYLLAGEPFGFYGETSGALVRLAPPPPATPCEPSPPSPPVLEIHIDGDGEVVVDGVGSCTQDCTLPVERFQQLDIEVIAGDGQLIQAVSGACDGTPCVAFADDTTVTLDVSFEAPDATLFGVDGSVRALGAGADHAFVVGQLGPSELIQLDGQIVADGAAGDGAWIAALDAQGVVAHAPIPSSPTGPYPRRVAVDPGDDTAAVLFAAGEVARFTSGGALTTYPAPGGAQFEAIGIDGTGQIAVAGYSGDDLVITSIDDGWTTTLPAAGLPLPTAVLGLPGGGFVIVVRTGGSLTIGPDEVWTGPPSSIALVRLDATGAVVGGQLVAATTAPGTERAWTDGASVFLAVQSTAVTGLPLTGAYVERYSLDGVLLDGIAASSSAVRWWTYPGGVVALGYLHSTASPWGGGPLNHVGGVDRTLAWFDDAGNLVAAASFGTAGDDLIGFPEDPAVVLPDGSVYMHTPADAVVSAPWAIGYFAGP